MIRARLADFNSSAFWAGITAFIWYAFGAAPLLVIVASQVVIGSAQVSSWFFIVMLGAAVVSLPLSIVYRQPVQIGWTLPGLVFLASVADGFTFPELVGANLMAGALIVVLGVLGFGRRLMVWVPLPITMAMFAGSILAMMLRIVDAAVTDAWVAGLAVAAYLAGRVLRTTYVPPVGLALLAGAVAAFVADRVNLEPFAWAWPQIVVPDIAFSAAAFVAVSVPLVVLALGLGNVQALAVLIDQGYRVPVNVLTVVTGLNGIVNALLGGHPASIARAGTAMLAGPDAGPVEGRYWSAIVANVLTIILAMGASVAAVLADVLPASYLAVIGGLAILAPFQDAMRRTFGSTPLQMGALAAFLVAATPFDIAGIPSGFWALIVGIGVSLALERGALVGYWRSGGAVEGVQQPAERASR